MAFLIALRNFLYSFVEEKAEKFKETQRIMGVRDSAYVLSWALFLTAKCIFVLLIVIVPTAISGYYDQVPNGAWMGIFVNVCYMFAASS